MCARRFLIVIVFLILLFVAGAFAIYQWGGRALISQAVPQGHFAASEAGSGPDYAQIENWLARPGIGNDSSKWKPDGAPAISAPATPAQIFYIHPTTYLARDRWNAPLNAGGDGEFRTRLFVQSQASAFAQLGQVWAPRYRQAAYGAFLLSNRDAEQALSFAYGDAAAAFDEFMKNVPADAPIILAGHSQGALHLERLLREKIAGKPIARRIVAAYVVGWPISTTADLPALGLPACAGPAETGCILSWMTFGDPPNPDFIFSQWNGTKGYNGAKRQQADTLCVNPINGTKGGAAPPQENAGTLIPSVDMQSATLEAGAVGAHCQNGLLILDGAVPQIGSFTLPGNNYHVYDYSLFWGSIRRDAARRLAAWRP